MKYKELFLTIILIFFFTYSSLAMTLNLKMALDVGLNNNQELKIAIEKLKAAESSVAMARSSYFPAIEVKGTYTYMGVIPQADMSAMGYSPLPTPTDPYQHTHTFESFKIDMARQNNYEASASLTQPIFMWGKLSSSYQVAKIAFQIEEQNYKMTRLKVINDIKSAFYKYLLDKEKVKLREENYNQLNENVKISEVNYKSGIITKYYLMAVSIQLANLEPMVLQAQNDAIISKENLKNILNLVNDDFDVDGDFKYGIADYHLDQLQEMVLKDNPSLKILILQKDSMDKLISLSRSANKPSLVGILNYKYSYIPSDAKTFGGNNASSWNAVLALSIPVSEWFPWSKTMNDIDKSKANYEQMVLAYEQMKDSILLQLKQVFLNLNKEYKLIQSQKQNVDNAKETYAFRQKQYKNGLIKYTELLTAQVALTDAETNYLQAIYNYILAKTNLDKLLGKENVEEF